MPKSSSQPRIILASRSPDRRSLLEHAGYEVDVIEVDVEERLPDFGLSPDACVLTNAMLKAEAASRRVKEGLIVAADTLAVVAGKVLGKPQDRDDACRMLELLSGSRNQVLTGLALCRMPERLFVAAVETTELWMRPWDRAAIEAYLDGGQWRDRAGAYAIQEANDPFVERIEGSVSNVIGLPMERLERLLEEMPDLLRGRDFESRE